MDDGRWTVDDGRWTMDDGRWTVDGGRWTMDDGRWTVDGGRWDDDRKIKATEEPFFLFVATKERIKEKTREVVRFRALRSATKGAALGSRNFSEEKFSKDFNC